MGRGTRFQSVSGVAECDVEWHAGLRLIQSACDVVCGGVAASIGEWCTIADDM